MKDLLFRSSAANSKKIEKCSKIFFIISSFSKTFFHDKNENDFSKAKRNSNSKLGNGKLGRYDDSRILQLFSGSKVCRGAAIAQYICLHLTSCHPGFESQAKYLRVFQFIFELCHVGKTKINKKRPELAHFLKVCTLSFSEITPFALFDPRLIHFVWTNVELI